MKFFQVSILLLLASPSLAQPSAVHKFLQVGVVPGLSTNGIDPQNYRNNLSLNLISGYASSLNGFELSGFSSFNQYSSSGIVVSGFANIVGGNRKQAKEYSENELNDLSADFHGAQIASLANLVTGELRGFQIAGLYNAAALGDVTGAQLSGFMNKVNGHLSGIQVSGLINYSAKSVTGLQLASLINSTKSDVYGLQLSVWNAAENLYGPKSETNLGTGSQVGVVNISPVRMDGFQLGLINKGGSTGGVQVGLINFNSKMTGYSIGLLNLGTGMTGVRLWTENGKTINLHFLTGSKHLSNSFIVGYQFDRSQSLIGYSIGHADHFRKGSFFSHYELMVRTAKFSFSNPKFNPIYTLQETFGIHLRKGIYLTLGAGINYDEYFNFQEKKKFFPSVSIGLGALE